MDLKDGIDKEDSLYQRVARAFIEVLLPVLDIRCQDVGKVKHTLFNSNTTSSLLAGADTQGGLDAAKTAGNALAPQPVPIVDRSLSEWDDYLLDFQHLVAPQSSNLLEFLPFGEIDTMDEGNADSDVMEEHWSKGIPTKDKEYVQQEKSRYTIKSRRTLQRAYLLYQVILTYFSDRYSLLLNIFLRNIFSPLHLIPPEQLCQLQMHWPPI